MMNWMIAHNLGAVLMVAGLALICDVIVRIAEKIKEIAKKA